MQEQELASLRMEVAALKGSHTESLMAAAHSEVTKTAPGTPSADGLKEPKESSKARVSHKIEGGQSKSRDMKRRLVK